MSAERRRDVKSAIKRDLPADNVGMSVKSERQSASTTEIDRRHHPRIAVMMPVAGGIVPEGDEVTLLNISEGGFSIRAPSELPIGATWRFGFTLSGTDPIEVRGRIAHTMRTTDAGNAMYVVGVEFVDDGSEAFRTLVKRLVDATHS
jgi:hypothetical protein